MISIFFRCSIYMLLCTSCYTYTYLTTAAGEKQMKPKKAHSERRAQRASERPSAAKKI